ncbi:MAG: glycosyltransferase [Bacteroidota bacterium]
MANKKGVSVIICTYNGAKRLPSTLAHIAAQEVSDSIDWEVILIDNNSKDGSGLVARELWEKAALNVPFSLFVEPNAGLSHAKARGLKEAQKSYLIYVDDDNSISSNYVQEVFDIFEAYEDVAVCAGDGFLAVPEEFDLPTWWEKFQYAYAVGRQGEKKGYSDRSFLWGASSAFRVSALKELYDLHELYLTGRIGDKLTAGEDAELCMSLQLLGYRLFYSPKLRFEHHIPIDRMTREYLRKVQAGFGASSVILSIYSDLLKERKTAWKTAYQAAKRGVFRKRIRLLQTGGELAKDIAANLSYSKARRDELRRFKTQYNATYDLLKDRFKLTKENKIYAH